LPANEKATKTRRCRGIVVGYFVMPAEPVTTLVEPMEIPDIYVNGLGRMEFLSDGAIRMIFYAERNGERVAVLSMVMNAEAAVRNTALFTEAMSRENRRLG
jgi:hypothetical protein